MKLRFTGASCQSEEPWSTVAVVTRGGGELLLDVAGEHLEEIKTKRLITQFLVLKGTRHVSTKFANVKMSSSKDFQIY